MGQADLGCYLWELPERALGGLLAVWEVLLFNPHQILRRLSVTHKDLDKLGNLLSWVEVPSWTAEGVILYIQGKAIPSAKGRPGMKLWRLT